MESNGIPGRIQVRGFRCEAILWFARLLICASVPREGLKFFNAYNATMRALKGRGLRAACTMCAMRLQLSDQQVLLTNLVASKASQAVRDAHCRTGPEPPAWFEPALFEQAWLEQCVPSGFEACAKTQAVLAVEDFWQCHSPICGDGTWVFQTMKCCFNCRVCCHCS